ncbi:MAG: hypothetical protein WDN03_03010 [Rhizomicrobium sp.]
MNDPIAFDDLPSWTFIPAEISPGNWRVDGVHPDGRSVTRSGTDLELLLVECADDARQSAGNGTA